MREKEKKKTSLFYLVTKGPVLLLRIMLISRLCRVGPRVAQELSRGGYRYMSGTRYAQGPCRQYRRLCLITAGN
ncbi:hypothetical protein V6N13_095036 [Hibiscus sabdariffa]